MQLEVKIDSSCTKPKVIILTEAMTDEVNDIVKKLSECGPELISGARDGRIEVIEPTDIIRAWAEAGKVFAATQKGEYTLRLRLYELEGRLPPKQFVRISNSEIINLKKVNSFDVSLAGTVCVKLADGAVTYVSRRCVPKLKKILGI